jgi:bifunctional non-homologous end joining protein LigD
VPRASAAAQLAEYRRKRDFSRTREPRGGKAGDNGEGSLRFVVQKHAARNLHFDLRLELDGVMKSWAVPKGPSTDPAVKRLAMQVEDHPIEYNEFEGTIPQGDYGGGTVMLWDTGTYTVEGSAGDDEKAMRERYRKGDVKIVFHGKRLRGSYALVRIRPREESAKPTWLLIKHRDKYASSSDIVAKHMTSVVSGRTIEKIAGGRDSAVWRSDRKATRSSGRARSILEEDKPAPAARTRESAKTLSLPRPSASRERSTRELALQPMFASIGSAIPTKGDWTFEPKYDGVRVLAYCTKEEARLITRNGIDKSAQFPEIAVALRKLASATRRSLVLDGEIVALTEGTPARFQVLQGRMHVTDQTAIERHRESSPAGIVLFDILLDGDEALLHEPWETRRERLEKRITSRASGIVRLTESFRGDGERLLDRARKEGWEGVIAKRVDSVYEPGARSRAWLKLKIEYKQEFVVGGWTEPRNSRQHLGAILVGYYDGKGNLIYAGHTGGGFSQKTLAEMHARLKPLERNTSPFTTTPRTNERVHWAEPKVVVEVKFNEWTVDGRLRQPIYLGVRTDKPPTAIRRETQSVQEEDKESSPSSDRAPRKRRPAGTRRRSRQSAGAR